MAQQAGNLLVADADPRVRRALRTLARAAGPWTVVEAADAEQAHRAARPTAAVVEPLLPALAQGCALIRDLTGCGVRVLALSLRAESEPAARAAGATAFLTKSCTPEHLLEGIERMLAVPVTRRA
ncbi:MULTISPECIES: response regulator transcription factor [Pseudonocardia]|uniref:Response regulatory domain-containing protein n=2 Tax=Pseudonocardia TaxID=1847 RepID=A0A1Y2N013_PSEAH|nr:MULTISPECIES: response regulator transcription factor [Pseudonocardia]OSY40762.1 hypothetical protein BG845_02520 [Pseudonocardia autotrophica]TDN71931.1 response regulator receiver domain-containing protein [Pseudonocardia autotrophica]BBG02618.1 hypothetical protein Pdca_38270 [Pseudonocardia autotrophica]GEC24677.1 hypothetical protein PSA01_17060 [Pseudonocardia saturnea]